MLYAALVFDVGRQLFPDRPYAALSDEETIQVRVALAQQLYAIRQTLAPGTGLTALGFSPAGPGRTDEGLGPTRPGQYL